MPAPAKGPLPLTRDPVRAVGAVMAIPPALTDAAAARAGRAAGRLTPALVAALACAALKVGSRPPFARPDASGAAVAVDVV